MLFIHLCTPEPGTKNGYQTGTSLIISVNYVKDDYQKALTVNWAVTARYS
jgi:hypothetical protein